MSSRKAWSARRKRENYGICGSARHLSNDNLTSSFFTGCHYFVPLWDKNYDKYESFIERTPFSTNGLLAVAAKIRAGNGQSPNQHGGAI